ncbi:hypothetical protein MBUL_01895 [Methylobacterium bullatum]|uniref:YjiS-like domain-containing protein n=1 Tax=Methylobacterium bullatum TaxID=570505 RepID=A0A679IV92_9HYPH|nr:hypothetical protein MBUL_01895 [Methylobacterium bullatum]
MTTLLKPQSATHAGALSGRLAQLARQLLANAAAGLSRQAMNRRVLRKLSVMSDRELKDIGLIRQDVTDAGTGEADASQFLIGRRDERREARRPRIVKI